MSGEMVEHALDLREVAFAHDLERVRVRRPQRQARLALARLQRREVGMHVLGAELRFEPRKTASPQIVHDFQ